MKRLDLKEDKQHGSADFPVALYRVDKDHAQYVMPCHWHAECELIHVDAGRFAYDIDSESGVARAGDILFVNSGALHAGMPEDSVYRCAVFSLDPLMMAGGRCRELLGPFAQGRRRVQLRLPSSDEDILLPTLRLMDALRRRPPGYALTVQGLLLALLGAIVEKGYSRHSGAEDEGSRKKIRQLKEALALIERAYASPLTLEDLARAAGMSPKYFCHFFKRMTQCTPMDYVSRHRIEVARTKLSMGCQDITELAYDCGFNDLSYFIRVFKKHTGVTPGRYEARMGAIDPGAMPRS